MALDLKLLKEERFLIPVKIVLVYVVWKVFHYFAITPGTALHVHWVDFCLMLGHWYAVATSATLTFLGMKATADGVYINLIESYRRVEVADHCLALPAKVILVGSVLVFKGSWKDKAWFIPLGLLGIIIINIIRLMFISVAWVHLTRYFFDLHHNVIYMIITYGFIFMMIIWWMNRQTRAAE